MRPSLDVGRTRQLDRRHAAHHANQLRVCLLPSQQDRIILQQNLRGQYCPEGDSVGSRCHESTHGRNQERQANLQPSRALRRKVGQSRTKVQPTTQWQRSRAESVAQTGAQPAKAQRGHTGVQGLPRSARAIGRDNLSHVDGPVLYPLLVQFLRGDLVEISERAKVVPKLERTLSEMSQAIQQHGLPANMADMAKSEASSDSCQVWFFLYNNKGTSMAQPKPEIAVPGDVRLEASCYSDNGASSSLPSSLPAPSGNAASAHPAPYMPGRRNSNDALLSD